ncbi:hypothetical protein [Burkholderia latens]|uniref:hypothetical protein n=1 Tax=Burkholderia latens TaxID=488446 RepID=UPI00157D9B0B|nr:hypothetical protein [Burkholderia latens]
MTSRPAPKKPPTPAPTPTPAKLKPLPFAFPFPRKGRGQSEASAQFTDEHEVYRLLAEGEQSGAYLVSRKVEYAVESAFVFWARNNLNSASDNGAVADVTKIVNGGQNGYADRRGRYNKVAPPLGISGDQFMNACPASLVSIIAAVSAIAHAEGLCTEKEATIFNCELEKSVSSLCQSAESGALAYRNGMGGKINFQIADNKENKRDVFYFSNASYAGGAGRRTLDFHGWITRTICTTEPLRRMMAQRFLRES